VSVAGQPSPGPGTVRVADVTTISALRRAWTEQDAGSPIDDAGFAPASSLMVRHR
jgi:hypothetical protein